MIRLVLNADDLGFHSRIDEGIFISHERGLLTSSTILASGPNFEQAIVRAKKAKLPLGVHLCLTSHLNPVAHPKEVRWLAPGGRFRKNWAELSTAWVSKLIPVQEVVHEFRCQVDKVKAAGIEVTHLDTHQHLHLLPGMTSIVEGLAAQLKLPIRWPTERPSARWVKDPASAVKSMLLTSLAFLKPRSGVNRVQAHGVFDSGRLNEKRLLRMLSKLTPGDHEIVMHPGLDPGVVSHDPTWKYNWESELEALVSPRVKMAIAQLGIELVSYRAMSAVSA
jgi:predicted glycoside hydrolase/deacetylase ChbG (UPF0249 family)